MLRNSRIEYASFGDYSYLGEHWEVAVAWIGKFFAFANIVRFGTPNHPMQRPSQHRFTYVPEHYEKGAKRDAEFSATHRDARVVVGHDVWIGHSAIILLGVTVADGAVIGAGPAVSGDGVSYNIFGGVLAWKMRERFPREIAVKLNAISWWNWSEEKLFGELAAFQADDIEAFCARFAPAA